jgi:tRNA 2-thiouridine synthesizing protein A
MFAIIDMNENDIQVLDLRGLKCPMPVLKANKAMKALASEDQIWLETTDPLAIIDIPAFCNENGHSLVRTESMDDHNRFLVQKG